MNAVELFQLIDQHDPAGQRYQELMRSSGLSVGLYLLPAGAVDTQQPHTEDEVYYIVRGRGQIRVDQADRPVQPGSLVFVAAGVEHRFHTISEDLAILVCFGPAEYSNAPSAGAGADAQV